MRNLVFGAVAIPALLFSATARAQSAFRVDAKPLLVIGEDDRDPDAQFATVTGATRLPNGQIVVGDRNEFALHFFDPSGRPLRKVARKGKGPGEVFFLKFFSRCGDSLFTGDLDADRISVFSRDGRFIRSFRFGAIRGEYPPMVSVCGPTGVFLHHGWETDKEMTGDVFRAPVPFWLSRADSVIGARLGEYLGMEMSSQLGGVGPRPLGARPVIALGRDRAYVSAAERYEILVHDLSGVKRATIVENRAIAVVTPADLARAQELEVMQLGEPMRKAAEAAFRSAKPAKTLPAYRAMIVDSEELLWVQEYPRAARPGVRWAVFGKDGGKPRAELTLPAELEVFEIGRDYILGRYLDPDESIPQVRLYRLQRPRG